MRRTHQCVPAGMQLHRTRVASAAPTAVSDDTHRSIGIPNSFSGVSIARSGRRSSVGHSSIEFGVE